VNSLQTEATQSLFLVKAGVALTPMLMFCAADAIGWFLRRTLRPHSERATQSGGDARDKLMEPLRLSHDRAAETKARVIQAVGRGRSRTR
jgi:hypothetical protein